jgi:hypothetical protein
MPGRVCFHDHDRLTPAIAGQAVAIMKREKRLGLIPLSGRPECLPPENQVLRQARLRRELVSHVVLARR